MPSVPCIACYISALDYDRPRVQEPSHVSKLHIRERQYDEATDTWGHGQGNAFTVERLMPAPYKLTMKTDIWTSNTTQQLQILEQILPLFSPALELQSTDNYVDWTSLSAIFLESVTWTSRSVPAMSASNQMNISTLTFSLPIWISLPAKVKKMGVIEKIIASIYDENTGTFAEDILSMSAEDLLSRMIITPMNYGVIYSGNILRLYRQYDQIEETIDGVTQIADDTYSWKTLVELYGGFIRNGITRVRLDQTNGSVVVGTVSYHPADSTALLFNPIMDTIPANTVDPIDAIIDPYNVPVDSVILAATAGTRYLILDDIGSLDNAEPAIAWGGASGNSILVAKANDIIQYDGTKWFVSFAAAGQPEIKYVTNLKSGIQFKWDPETQEWAKSVEGKYQPGSWTIVLSTVV